jgi:hypothetical protein
MQEEVENRTVALAVSTTRMTGRVLKAALIKVLAEMKKSRDSPPQIPHGKQTVKELRREFWKGLHTVGRRIPGGSLDLLGAWKAFLKAKVKDFKFETNVMRHCH